MAFNIPRPKSVIALVSQNSAVEIASVETQNFLSTRYQHQIGGFIVDNDFILTKFDKRTHKTTTTSIWNNIAAPFVISEHYNGTPTLIDANSPLYKWIWKPEQWHPCLVERVAKDLVITSMINNRIIGYGLALTSGMTEIRGFSDGDAWKIITDMIQPVWTQMNLTNMLFLDGEKQQILNYIATSTNEYWYSIAHGDYFGFCLNGQIMTINNSEGSAITLLTTDIARARLNKPPYTFSFVSSCNAMDRMDNLSWAQVLTKDYNKSVVIGLKHFDTFTSNQSMAGWCVDLWQYIANGLTPESAFENALADHPFMNGFCDIYRGKQNAPVEPINVIVNISPAYAGSSSINTGFYRPIEYGKSAFTAIANPGYVFDHWEFRDDYFGSNSYYTTVLFEETHIPVVSGLGFITTATAYFKPSIPDTVSNKILVNVGDKKIVYLSYDHIGPAVNDLFLHAAFGKSNNGILNELTVVNKLLNIVNHTVSTTITDSVTFTIPTELVGIADFQFSIKKSDGTILSSSLVYAGVLDVQSNNSELSQLTLVSITL